MTSSAFSPNKTLPLLAHIYDGSWSLGNNAAHFKKTIPIINTPTWKYTWNSGLQPVTLQLPKQDTLLGPATSVGDVILVTEVGPWSDGSVIYGGICEDTPYELSDRTSFGLDLSPFILECGDTPFFNTYSSATDIATMVRDAATNTKHLNWTTSTIPLTGITGIADFSYTGTTLKCFERARLIGGPNYFYYVDENATVWFGNGSVGSATYTVARGQDFQAINYKAPISKLKNWVPVIGGVPQGSRTAIAAVYDAGVIRTGWPIPNPITAPTTNYGTRARLPHVHIAKLLDQTTLNNIANSLGRQLNRRQTVVELTIQGYGTRFNLSSASGASLRYFDPSSNQMDEAYSGSGGYSSTYLITDLEVTGNVQKAIMTDLAS